MLYPPQFSCSIAIKLKWVGADVQNYTLIESWNTQIKFMALTYDTGIYLYLCHSTESKILICQYAENDIDNLQYGTKLL